MAKRNQHVIPLGNGWAFKGDGNKKFTVITETQRDAVTVVREIAKSNNADLVIHSRNGKIRDSRTATSPNYSGQWLK